VKYNNDAKHELVLKAGALLCPVCCVEFIEVEIDLEVEGALLQDVTALRCPVCQEEQFTPAQLEAIEERLRSKIEP
jgi:hypothetical protein